MECLRMPSFDAARMERAACRTWSSGDVGRREVAREAMSDPSPPTASSRVVRRRSAGGADRGPVNAAAAVTPIIAKITKGACVMIGFERDQDDCEKGIAVVLPTGVCARLKVALKENWKHLLALVR